jgi:hypothetical protein
VQPLGEVWQVNHETEWVLFSDLNGRVCNVAFYDEDPARIHIGRDEAPAVLTRTQARALHAHLGAYLETGSLKLED